MKKALLISCFNWYKARLKPIRDLLIGTGYDVTVLLSDYEHITKKTIKDRYEECTYIHVPQYKSNMSFQRIHSHLSFGRSVGDKIKEYKPDLVYFQVPPNNIARYCMEYKSNHPDTKLIMDIIDLWPESMPLGVVKKTMLAKKWQNWRDQCIIMADHVFTECDLYREKLNLDSGKASTLYLFKEQTEEERALVQEIIRKKKDEATTKFAYLGSMNNIIDIDGICSVLKQFTGTKNNCELHAIGDGESRELFEKSVKATGCKAVFYGPVYNEKEKIKTLAACDYAFNMMKDTSEVGLTIKSIDYLSYGLPLINNIKGDTWKTVDANDLGINVLPAKSIVPKKFSHEDILYFFNQHYSLDMYTNNLKEQLKHVLKN